MNPDFRDMLSALIEEEAEFLIVGAYAMAIHGLPRATGDIDLWVRPTQANAKRVWRALESFGARMGKLECADLSTPDIVFQIGIAPRRIDLLTSISGVSFGDAWDDRLTLDIDGLRLNALSRHQLIVNKRAAGRPKDLADAAWLEESDPKGHST